MAEDAAAVGSTSPGGSNATPANDPATTADGLLSEHRSQTGLDTDALAGSVQALSANDPQQAADVTAALESRMTPVERGQFAAALEAANDNPAPTGVYNRDVAGETFQVGHPDAPAVSSWGGMAPGTAYRDAWDRTATELGTTDPAAITSALEAQLYGPSGGVTQLDPITVTADPPQQSQEGVGSFIEGAILGDFGNNNSWSATGGQIAMGFVPIAGQIADARDTAAAIGQVWNGEEGGWLNLGASVIGWVPGVGDGIKAAIRGGERLADAGTEVVQTAVRRGDEVAGVVDDIPVRRFDDADDFNRAANNPAPNTSYTYGNFSYRTDALGRVVEAEGRIEVAPAGRNDPDLQAQIGREGRSTDVGFHIFADRFGAQTNRLNVVPGNGKPLNDGQPNLNQGPYKRFENMLAELAETPGNRVEARVEVQYDPANASTRPDRFVAHFSVNGGDWVQQTFVNK